MIYPDNLLIEVELMQKMTNTNKKRGERVKLINNINAKKIYSHTKNTCKFCNKEIPFNKYKKVFCNHSCATSFNNINRSVVYTKEGMTKLKELGKKQLENLSKGRKPAIKYQLECKICNVKFERSSAGKNNKTCSFECKRVAHSLYNFRENKTFGKTGYYKGIYCGSSWELAFLIHNLDMQKNIERCKLVFEYEYNGIKSKYYPDFTINNIIYEIKGRETEEVKAKTQAVIDAGYKIELIRKDIIEPIIKDIKKKYKVKKITDLYEKEIFYKEKIL